MNTYDPGIKDLCASIRRLRETLMRRAAAVGCQLDEASLPEAEAIVDHVISEFLFSDELGTRHAAETHGTDSRVMTLLMLQCVAALDEALPPKPVKRRPYYKGEAASRRPDLRAAAANPSLSA